MNNNIDAANFNRMLELAEFEAKGTTKDDKLYLELLLRT